MEHQSVSKLRSDFFESTKAEKKGFPPGTMIGWRDIRQMSIWGHFTDWAKELETLDTEGTGRDKRRSMRARYIGLVREDMSVTEPGRVFYKSVLENQPDRRDAVLSTQVEKWYFPVAEFLYKQTEFQTYTQLGYGLYPVFLILRTLFYVGERDHTAEPRFSLSSEEFRLFCITAKSHNDYEERGKLIIDFRKNPEDCKELRSLIKEGRTYTDRILQDIRLSSYIEVKDDRIVLTNPEKAREKLLKFEYLLHTNNLFKYQDNKDNYFDLLYDAASLLRVHETKTKLDLTTDIVLLNYISDYIKGRKFTYEESSLRSFYASLRAKPFVILTGLSGTGKTKLCELFALAIAEDPDSQFLRVSVKPDWNDDRFMLGFFNPLTETYNYEPFLDFLLRASSDKTKPYVVCLDEMNLAHVEYYFSSFLSGLESLDKRIQLHDFPSGSDLADITSEEVDLYCDRLKINAQTDKDKRKQLVNVLRGLPPKQIEIPSNLLFVGTVNIDETTFLFSPKVLDRANVIEFMKVDLTRKAEEESTGLKLDEVFRGVLNRRLLFFDDDDYEEWRKSSWQEIVEERLAPINEILRKSSLHFGYRTRDEILRFLYCSRDLLSTSEALDCQIKQRILTKIKGPATIQNTIEQLRDQIEAWGYTNSLEKIKEMEEKLEQGFTSYF